MIQVLSAFCELFFSERCYQLCDATIPTFGDKSEKMGNKAAPLMRHPLFRNRVSVAGLGMDN